MKKNINIDDIMILIEKVADGKVIKLTLKNGVVKTFQRVKYATINGYMNTKNREFVDGIKMMATLFITSTIEWC